jgi:pilus assembly protein CpaF
MTDTAKNALISQLKTEIQNHADITNMNDDQIRALASQVLEDRVEQARANSQEVYSELSSINFKEKNFIRDAVYESIRGLGVLGQIISDSEVT